MYNFPEITLLITHYNRSNSLARLLSVFSNLNCIFFDIIVSDDCSRPEQLESVIKLKDTFNFKLITANVNGGLAKNINKGQDAVLSKYTLYVQEDFVPTALFPSRLRDAMMYMDEDVSLDIVRFYAYFKHPILVPFKNGFSLMKFNFWNQNHIKFYIYSDHPHLRRSNFFEKFGRYKEGINMDLAEFDLAIRFIQAGGKGLFFDEFTSLFEQKNSATEPSMASRNRWRESRNFFILAMRAVYLRYRWLKGTFQVLFRRS
jgi:glycosyltransferase involved in cell wall biosynthesis